MGHSAQHYLERQQAALAGRPRGIGSRIVELIRRQGAVATARHLRTVSLHKLHERLHDRRRSASEAQPTGGKRELSTLTIASERRTDGVHYLGSPTRVLDWLLTALPLDRKDYTFVDIGAGRGRVMAWALDKGFKRVHGIEFAAELAAEAVANMQHVARQRPHLPVAFVDHADATRAIVPGGPLVVYLFNPFGAETLKAFVAHLGLESGAAGRPIEIIYVNPRHAKVLQQLPQLRRRPLPVGLRLKLGLASPYAVHIYSNSFGTTVG